MTGVLFWCSLSLLVVTLLVGLLGLRWGVLRSGARSYLHVSNGVVELDWNPRRSDNAPIWTGWRVHSYGQAGWTFGGWLPERGMNPIGGWRFIVVPLWMFAAPGLIGVVGFGFLRRRHRRRVAGSACVACGYDRRGLPEAAVCPECGVVGEVQPRVRQTS
jgi:hypothetical protein